MGVKEIGLNLIAPRLHVNEFGFEQLDFIHARLISFERRDKGHNYRKILGGSEFG